MTQFGKILSFELKYYLKNKIFIGVTVFAVLLIAVVMFFPRLSQLFAVETDGESSHRRAVMLVKAADPERAERTLQAFAGAFADYDVRLTDEAEDVIAEKVASGEIECAFSITSPTTYVYYVDNIAMDEAKPDIADLVLQQLYQAEAMGSVGMSDEQIADALGVQVSRQISSTGKNQMLNFFYTYIMIFFLYMGILLYGQMVATNVASEKSSRAMEVLITSARPTAMMFGKVIASCLAGLIQIAAVFGSALLFYQINQSYWSGNMIISSIFNIPPSLLVYMLVFFVLGFFIYGFLYGAVGSTASKLEDINTSVLPITMLFLAAFIVVVTSMPSGNVDNTLMRACSFIPFTSPMSMFTRIAMSTVPWHEIALSIVILIASTVGVGFLAAKIYRVGVLMYGTTPKIGEIIKAVWKA